MIRGEIMVNNNLNINLNSTVPLNSINYKSNQHRKSFPYEYNQIQLKMIQRDGMVMEEMKVLVMEMMMMMISMKSGVMVMMIAMISPLRERISSVDFSMPGSFSLSGILRPQRRLCLNLSPPLTYVFGDDEVREGARLDMGQGALTQAPGRATLACGAPWLLSTPPSGFLGLLGKYNFLVFFWNFPDL
jgi:hypothetical protein